MHIQYITCIYSGFPKTNSHTLYAIIFKDITFHGWQVSKRCPEQAVHTIYQQKFAKVVLSAKEMQNSFQGFTCSLHTHNNNTTIIGIDTPLLGLIIQVSMFYHMEKDITGTGYSYY